MADIFSRKDNTVLPFHLVGEEGRTQYREIGRLVERIIKLYHEAEAGVEDSSGLLPNQFPTCLIQKLHVTHDESAVTCVKTVSIEMTVVLIPTQDEQNDQPA